MKLALLFFSCSFAAVAFCAETIPAKPLIDFGAPGADARIASDGGNAGATFKIADGPKGKALEISIQPGPANWPGITIKPDGAAWDLSAFGRVEAHVTNTGASKVGLNLRVDNAGDWRDNPWNTESVELAPGASGTITVIFGFSYGRKPGYALKSAAVSNLLLFTTKAKEPLSFRVDSIVATGPAGEKPPVDPNSVRIRPKGGVILGPGVATDPAKQIETKGGAQASVAGETLRAVFPAAKGEQFVAFKPAIGRWELVEAYEVRVKLKNDGQTPTTPSIQLLSNGGPTDSVTIAAPLAPGAETEIIVPFAASVPAKGMPVPKAGYYGTQKGTGTGFTSDATSAVKITTKQDGEATLLVQSIIADAPPAQMPEWLGKRPPVDGEWSQTFNEDFEGTTIDPKKWNIYGPNWWDKATHWSKDNLSVGNGNVTLHFEKKRGFHNDDPNEKSPKTLSGKNESDYVCGYLDTLGKFVQRYGYFEARVKLPTAPGLWPTFWMMPDRGVAAGGARSDTGNGAQELDIMEHLTRWGPYRYNIALHWDGYGKEHKSVGTTNNYIAADKDGYITAGLLWTPGSMIFYSNGKEAFRWEGERVSTVPSYFIIEFTTGGWDNNAVDDTKLPADYLLDYVRVWQRKDLSSDADSVKAPPTSGK
ncbi:MAG TPA: glycoside hydrolase family 16 protein [Planctomycetota bacterium]|jgi:beta-glucanase (GH16 family)